MIDGNTKIIAHLGYPTTTFKSPMIYNPWFESRGINASVVPMGVTKEEFLRSFPVICGLTNFSGALITMPHKIAVVSLLDDRSVAVEIAGSCNAVRREKDGRLIGDIFDGEGFVRGVARNGGEIRGRRLLVVGSGGVGSAIAASAAAAGAATIMLYDLNRSSMDALAERLRLHYPRIEILVGSNDPTGFDMVVNATPLGMSAGDPMPVNPEKLSPGAYVGEVVLKQEATPFLSAARARGCTTQIGIDMLFEQIPAYLEFFEFPVATPDELRKTATVHY
jgi:shikimate dehydrogenase